MGKITLDEYAEAWNHYISQLEDHKKCAVFSSPQRFTVYGQGCLKVHNLERIEAAANDKGMLSSIVLVQQLGSQIPQEVMLDFLEQRYRHIDPEKHSIAHVAHLAADLCLLSESLSRSSYQCTTNWFSPVQDIYMFYKHSRFNGLNIAIIMFGEEQYFLQVQEPLVKRRLASLRKMLKEHGIADPTSTHAHNITSASASN